MKGGVTCCCHVAVGYTEAGLPTCFSFLSTFHSYPTFWGSGVWCFGTFYSCHVFCGYSISQWCYYTFYWNLLGDGTRKQKEELFKLWSCFCLSCLKFLYMLVRRFERPWPFYNYYIVFYEAVCQKATGHRERPFLGASRASPTWRCDREQAVPPSVWASLPCLGDSHSALLALSSQRSGGNDCKRAASPRKAEVTGQP